MRICGVLCRLLSSRILHPISGVKALALGENRKTMTYVHPAAHPCCKPGERVIVCGEMPRAAGGPWGPLDRGEIGLCAER